MAQLPFCNSPSTPLRARGISIIEVLISGAIIGTALLSILAVSSLSLGLSFSNQQTVLAASLAQEAMEATRNFRDNTNWASGLGALSTGVAYHAQKSQTSPWQWQMILGAENVSGFSRSITLSSVSRDANSNIVLQGGTQDANTLKVTAQVSWLSRGRTHQVQLINYLMNWRQ